MPVDVVIERGSKRVFASAIDWHGWCRSAKTEDTALQCLAEYAGRYAQVLASAGIKTPSPRPEFVVVERCAGTATTDFGAPAVAAAKERDAVPPTRARRLGEQLDACWSYLGHVVRTAPPNLRKGPRGGGRDRDKMFDHVIGAECAYARRLGIKHEQPAIDDEEGIGVLRRDLLEACCRPAGRVVVERGWNPRYAARRIAWHALDHAWEIEDRS
jgi:hypothetical protein